MDIVTDAELAQFRADALDRMTSTCTVGRKAGRAAQDEATGLDSFIWDQVYTALPTRIGGASRDASAWTTETRAGGLQESVAERVEHFPWDTDNLEDGDVVEITGGENTGLFFQLVEAAPKDQATARRVPVKQILRPEGWNF